MSVVDPRQGVSGEVFYTLKVQKEGTSHDACESEFVMSGRDPHFPIQHRCIARPMHFNFQLVTAAEISEKYRFLSIKTKNTPMQYGHQIGTTGQRVSYQTLGVAKAITMNVETKDANDSSLSPKRYLHTWELAGSPNEFATIFPSPFSHNLAIQLCDEKGGKLASGVHPLVRGTIGPKINTDPNVTVADVLWTLILSFQPLQETPNQPASMPPPLAVHEAGPFRTTTAMHTG